MTIVIIFMINPHESMGPDWDRTRDPWICSHDPWSAVSIANDCPMRLGIMYVTFF